MLADMATMLSGWGATWIPALIEAAIKGSVLIAVAWLIIAFCRPLSAATRHWICLVALIGLAAIPLLSVMMPVWRILPQWTAAASHSPENAARNDVAYDRNSNRPGADGAAHAQLAHEEPAKAITAPPPEALASSSSDRRSSPPQKSAPSISTPASAAQAPATGSIAPAFEKTASPIPTAASSGKFTPTIAPSISIWGWSLLAWIAGVCVILIPSIAGALALWRLRRSSMPVTDAHTLRLAEHVSENLGRRRRARLLQRPGAMPMTFGAWRASILLPSESTDWTIDRMRGVLLHELGHVKRRDCLIEWITRLILSAY